MRLTLKQIEDVYGPNVRIVWKNLPLEIHPDAVGAALAAEAANNQGKFWAFHDLLFANQDKLSTDGLKQFARELDLNIKQFEADMQDPERKKTNRLRRGGSRETGSPPLLGSSLTGASF